MYVQLMNPAKSLLLSALFLSTALSSYAEASFNIIRTSAPVSLAHTPPESEDHEEEEVVPVACYDANNVGKVGTSSNCKGLLIVENGSGKFGVRTAIKGITVDGKRYGAGDIFTGQVTDMSGLFKDAKNIVGNIGYWDTSNVTNMYRMFQYSNFNQDIDSWDVSSVADMTYMFNGANVFNKDIGSWNVSNVIQMSSMFEGANVFNKDIGNWNVSRVTSMDRMFKNARSFNQDIGRWNTYQNNRMYGMFNFALVFNQDLSRWCVKNVSSKGYFDDSARLWENSKKPVWGSCPRNEDQP